MDFHKRFPTYETFMNPDVRALSKERLQEKLRENLKNSLITKAYSDQNCYMRCKPAGNGSVRGPGEKTYQYDGHSVNCKPGCYDPVSGNFDRLYGFDDGKVTQQPWSLNEERITEESWGAYARKDYTGYLPGRIDLNPYHDQIKDHTPILPVCYSTVGLGNDRKGLPCSCGDKYGNETFMVLNADYWRGQDYKDETDKFKTCLDRFKDMAGIHPGVFMINMCNAYYHLLVPVGQGTKSEKENKGAYKENLAMCDRIRWDHIWNEDSGDRAVDRAVCKTWREYAKSKHRDGGHSDFSWANSVLRKADICGKEHKKGKKGGKKNQ
ncbi:hypothetical protein FB567DRAFT_530708 [Paraphoma chrysanthemicola]|uniref:Uncharacterized protein n=1 Tax=Paraphoma chrysanthemicola TaxID=798071 RepID=A0A8K0R1R5_9PLEO|nr:hypothetical protein FB567DRAFT_530708 [Paraphoma chrysanthemicola]